ncbi:hypothetical protein BDV97DRAFT_186716 [Delphinella strobiligena]|nr:hypothetical protein BDV97DRAFT_186716 [Delphinella strobiligena]
MGEYFHNEARCEYVLPEANITRYYTNPTSSSVMLSTATVPPYVDSTYYGGTTSWLLNDYSALQYQAQPSSALETPLLSSLQRSRSRSHSTSTSTGASSASLGSKNTPFHAETLREKLWEVSVTNVATEHAIGLELETPDNASSSRDRKQHDPLSELICGNPVGHIDVPSNTAAIENPDFGGFNQPWPTPYILADSPPGQPSYSLTSLLDGASYHQDIASCEGHDIALSRNEREENRAGNRVRPLRARPFATVPSSSSASPIASSLPHHSTRQQASYSRRGRASGSRPSHSRRAPERKICEICRQDKNKSKFEFRGQHELDRHNNKQHSEGPLRWICLDPTPNQAHKWCKNCRDRKEYAVNYNAAEHLRRAHLNPDGSEKSGKKTRGNHRDGTRSSRDQRIDRLPSIQQMTNWGWLTSLRSSKAVEKNDVVSVDMCNDHDEQDEDSFNNQNCTSIETPYGDTMIHAATSAVRPDSSNHYLRPVDSNWLSGATGFAGSNVFYNGSDTNFVQPVFPSGFFSAATVRGPSHPQPQVSGPALMPFYNSNGKQE